MRSVSEERNERNGAIWLTSPDGTNRRRLSPVRAFDIAARWSPDGTRLVVSSAADSVRRLRLVDVATGASTVLAAEAEAHSAVWSPTGDALCFVGSVAVGDVRVAEEAAWFAAHPHARPAPPLVRETSRRARADGSGYRTRRQQLFSLSPARLDTPVPLVPGDAGADDVDPAWSPDGRYVAFVSSRSDDRRVFRERDVWVADITAGRLRRLTSGCWLWGPLTWSPDGRHIACFGMAALTVPLAIRMWVVALDGGGAVAASDGLGAHIWPHGGPVWLPDGERVIGAGGRGDAGALVVYDRRTRSHSIAFESEAVFGLLQLVPGGGVLAAASTLRNPSALVRASLDGGTFVPVFDVNGWLDEVDVAPAVRIGFAAADGLPISGWLVTPAERSAVPASAPSAAPTTSPPPPCVLDVHYGPNAAWGPAFNFGAQLCASRGIATLQLNPRGSAGYGDAFAAAADFGERDFSDLLAGLDALCAAGRIDGARLGITGLSYGGFMATWAIGQTDRFGAAVSINGISNQLSWYLLSDTGLFFYENAFGDPFADEEHRARYWRHSPLAHSARITTPLLLLQSEDDLRCPIDQGEALFGALVARGQTVELIRFPGAAHDLAGSAAPVHALLAHGLSLAWFERFLGA